MSLSQSCYDATKKRGKLKNFIFNYVFFNVKLFFFFLARNGNTNENTNGGNDDDDEFAGEFFCYI